MFNKYFGKLDINYYARDYSNMHINDIFYQTM